MQFLSQQTCIKFQTCSKPLRYHGDKSHWKLHVVYTCDFEVATLAWEKLHQVATTKIACVNRPLQIGLSKVLLCQHCYTLFLQSLFFFLNTSFFWFSCIIGLQGWVSIYKVNEEKCTQRHQQWPPFTSAGSNGQTGKDTKVLNENNSLQPHDNITITVPSRSSALRKASESDKVTKPNPLDLPVSRSMITCAVTKQ